MIEKILRRLRRARSNQGDRILEDIAFTVNLVKNGMTVKTGEHEALTRIFTGQKMYVDTRDISVSPHIMLDGQWETNLVNFARGRVKKDSVVFDIGANFGIYGMVLSTQNHEGKTFFFEANPDLIPYIEKSLSVNGLGGRSEVVNAVVTDVSEGYSNINVHNRLWGSATVHNISKDIIYKSHKIKNITLDSYCEIEGIEKVDIIKMDIEGFEDKAFAGMKKLLRKNPQLEMFMEFTAAGYSSPKSFYEDIRRYFDVCKIIDESSGKLLDVESYSDLSAYTEGWAMLYLSNN